MSQHHHDGPIRHPAPEPSQIWVPAPRGHKQSILPLHEPGTQPPEPVNSPLTTVLLLSTGVFVVVLLVLTIGEMTGVFSIGGLKETPPTAMSMPSERSTVSAAVPPVANGQQAPSGHKLVDAPGRLRIAVPQSWEVHPGPVEANLQADEPGGPGGRLLFGGNPQSPRKLIEVVSDFEKGTKDYHRILLSETGFGAAEQAVDWEYTFTKDGAAQHAQGRYWRMNGTDYVVYLACPESRWPQLGPTLRTAVENAHPK
ncbi:hypothetical protein D5S17_11590 [Pseudonocardiaceae bacterium YIM PH 21723]|nr:hypothetical protein D5S17_11590 [Pseudonocardiaceae bacterium YIM PH 21723]